MKPCSVCSHPKRDSIEKCLVNGDSLRTIEKIYDISKSALQRHKAEHLSLYSPAVAGDPAAIAKSDDLLAQLGDLIRRTLAALDRAELEGDDRMFLLAVREARSNTELMMKAQAYLVDRAAKEAPGKVEPGSGIYIYNSKEDAEAAARRDGGGGVVIPNNGRDIVRCEDLSDAQLAAIIASGAPSDNPPTGEPACKPETTLSPSGEAAMVDDVTVNDHLAKKSDINLDGKPPVDQVVNKSDSTAPDTKAETINKNNAGDDYLAELRRRRMQARTN